MKVRLYHFTRSPRLHLEGIFDIPEPQKGDYLVIPKKWFKTFSRLYAPAREAWMKVRYRAIHCEHKDGPLLEVWLNLHDHIMKEKVKEK